MQRAINEEDIHWIVRILTEDAELVFNRDRFYSALSLPLSGLYDIKLSISASGSTSDSFFRQTLVKWISKEGENATFAKFIQILEDECFRATADNVGKNVQRGTKSNLWFDVPPGVMYFTGRATILQELHKAITSQNEQSDTPCFAALSGMGGVGKTALAVEYAWEYQRTSYTNIAWIHADRKSTLRNSFHKLADNCGIKTVDPAGRKIGLENIANMIYRQLSGKALLIFDNVDNYLDVRPVLPSASPHEETPYVLITSRLSSGMWSDKVKVIGLDVFDEQESLDFLTKYLQLESELEVKSAREISQLLDNIPLGIRQAGAFIKMQREMHGGSNLIHLEKYSKEWEKNIKPALQYEHSAQTEDNYEKTVYCTLKSTFSSIKRRNRLTIRIIQLVSYLNPDYISNELFYNLKRCKVNCKLVNAIGTTGPCRTSVVSTVQKESVDEAIKLLCSYSILTNTNKLRVFKIHRLIQTVIKTQTEEKFGFDKLKEALNLIKTNLATESLGKLNDCFLIQAESVLAHANNCGIATKRFDLEELLLAKINFQLDAQVQKLINLYNSGGYEVAFEFFHLFDKSYSLKSFALEHQIYMTNYFGAFLEFIFSRAASQCAGNYVVNLKIIQDLGMLSIPIFKSCMKSSENVHVKLHPSTLTNFVYSLLAFANSIFMPNSNAKSEFLKIIIDVLQIISYNRKE